MWRQFLTGTAIALTLTTSILSADAQTTEINFGVISTEASLNQKKNWEPFVEAMSKATGLKVNAFYATDYAGVIEAMRFNKVQVAWYGNKSGMEAVDRASGQVFAQVVSKDGSIGYYSHVIVHKDSPYATIDDILKCDKRSISDRRSNSTSGFWYRPLYLRRQGIDRSRASRPCATPAIRPTQWRLPTTVSLRTNSAKIFSGWVTAPEARGQIKIIWTSPIIPLDPLVCAGPRSRGQDQALRS